MLGSVAERTVRLAPCPVMTVHAPGSRAADDGGG
jgi:nucleotide-binding universal stress UspA family protein